MAVRCPRCSASIDTTPDELGLLTCHKCGARLRTRQPVKVTVGGAAGLPALPRIDPSLAAPTDVDHVLARIDTPSPDATVRPGPIPKLLAPKPDAAFEMLLSELRAIKATQYEILGLLRTKPAAPEPEAKGTSVAVPPARPPGAGKLVLLVDDDPESQRETVAALTPFATVKTAPDGNGGLASIAAEKPDAIVLELDIGGLMPGRDFVNLVKATMEWIDIPLLLHTRLDVGEDATARVEHGADLVVHKGPGSAQALAAKLVALFAQG